MNSRARLVQSVVVVASIALGISSCKHETLDSGTQGLGLTFTPSPAGAGRFEEAHFFIDRIQALPVDPHAADIYGQESLLFRLTPFPDSSDRVNGVPIDPPGVLTLTQPFVMSNIALAVGTYKITVLEIKHPNMIDDDLAPPVPTDPEHCMDGVPVIDATNVGALATTKFNETDNFTFTIGPGQTTLAIKLDVPAFLQAYQACFTCQVGCGVNDPTQNCTVAPFNEAAFRTAVKTYLRFE